ncbi:acyltransferase [Agrobacterium rhizogenes]|nr:acyltransferase [Rhizobium rhizogenes]NTH70056.1 acyltransferase [Rhizobium rhizogenes]
MDQQVIQPTSASKRSYALGFQRNIHYLRGIAATGVMLGHAAIYYDWTFHDPSFRPFFPDAFGIYGVAIFFAISGYLMSELIKRQNAFEFLARRIVRIYPAFLIATAVSLLILAPTLRQGYNPLSALLAPIGKTDYPLRVEWTLVHEVFFYAALFLVALFRQTKFVPWLGAVWLLSIMVFAMAPHPRIGEASLPDIPLMVANTGFAAGLLISPMIKRVHTPLLFLTIFGVSLIGVYWLPWYPGRATAGIGSVFLVAAALQCDFQLPRTADFALRKLGDWSYAIYLIHVSVITAVFAFPYAPLSAMVRFPIAIVAAMLFAIALGEIDLRLHRVSRAMVQEIPGRRLVATIGLFFGTYLLICLLY